MSISMRCAVVLAAIARFASSRLASVTVPMVFSVAGLAISRRSLPCTGTNAPSTYAWSMFHMRSAPSPARHVDHGLGEGFRRFLRQVVADAAADQPVLVAPCADRQ